MATAPIPSKLTVSTGRRRPKASPLTLINSLVHHRHLIFQMTRREAIGRYRGSYLGLLWPFLNPIFLLVIYTIVFKYIFKARFNGRFPESDSDFALILFSSLIVFNVFAECIQKAPSLILMNANYVSKVVFPLEILPVNTVLSSLFHLLISLVPLVFFAVMIKGHLPATIWEWPLLLPLIFGYALGLTWLLSAVGVFLRDLSEAVLAGTTILMYASAIFYPISVVSTKVPEYLQAVVILNPIANLVEQSRLTAVMGQSLEWKVYAWLLVGSIACLLFGYTIFMRVKHTFADVV